MRLRSGELARVTDTTAPTIRYYEHIGLLPRASRVGGQHRYGDDDVGRHTFIRRCRNMGFPIEQVRILVTLLHNSERSCQDARDLAEAHLDVVRDAVNYLRNLVQDISGLLKFSDDSCCGGAAADCVSLDRLAEPTRW